MTRFIDISIFKRNRSFALLYSGQFISFIGTMITMVALPYQIYTTTHSTVMVGLLSFVQLIPLLFTALIGGVLADRHSRRELLIISEVILAIACIVLAVNASASSPSLIIVFVTASIMSAINGLHRPAFDGLIQQLLYQEDYKTVAALHSFEFSFCMITGPAIAGLIIASLGVSITYWVDFLTFFGSLTALSLLKNTPKLNHDKPPPVLVALKQGIDFAWSNKVLRASYSVDFIAMIFAMPNALFPALALQFGGVKTLGFLYAAPAVGSLIISVFSGWTANIRHEGRAIAVSAMCWGLAIIGLGLVHSITFALVFLALAGAADAVSGIFRISLWNNLIPHEFRGRLAGIEMLSYLSGPKLGDTRAGLVAKGVGIAPAILSGGILCVVGIIACCYRMRAFWAYELQQPSENSEA